MAELIPVEYRLGNARRRLMVRWSVVISLAAILSVSALVDMWLWQKARTGELNQLQKQSQEKSVLITQANELQARRLDLAARMLKMQELRDDKVLLALLNNVSKAFGDNDCLEYFHINVHSDARSAGKPRETGKYTVQLVGFTANDSTHADLVDRLTEYGRKLQPPLRVPPDATQRERRFDGEVIHFMLACEAPDAKGG